LGIPSLVPPASTPTLLRRTAARRNRALGYLLVFLLAHAVIAYLNRHHGEQQTNYFTEYVEMARYYKGEVTREILTYPMWGYPFVLLLLPRFDLVTVPQVVLGALAETLLLLRLREEIPKYRQLLTVLFLAAGPWYLLHSVKWPQSFAASFVVFGILLLDRSLRTNSTSIGLIAGVVLGVALYFRSEFLYLPLFIAVLSVFARFAPKSLPCIPVRPVLACAIAAWSVLIPWSIHYYKQTGHFSLTASQRGIVAFISLGQLPSNPWGAVFQDEYAYDYLRSQGINFQPQSDSGDRILFTEFKRRVKAHPIAFVKKMAWNGLSTLVSGFYSGDILLSAEQQRQEDLLKTRFKSLTIFGPSGIMELRHNTAPRAFWKFLYWVAAKGIGSLFVILSTIGLVCALVRGFSSPLLTLLGAYILYQDLLLVVLATEPRYLNGLYLAMVPFFIVSVTCVNSLLRRPVTRDRFGRQGMTQSVESG
jgi:hypothetical protein